MEIQISQCENTAPGMGNITTFVIKHHFPEAQTVLLKALSQLWESREYSELWRKEIKLPFLKPGTDLLLSESYQPKSTVAHNCILKLLEGMVNTKLM